ncbi:MAG: aldo/keto reductase [Anaerolineae bacterium]|jgi:voltage-dependent potassium channel beta subunit|nr:aldo/keto reductase [Anaerolineae bacterium]MBT7189032.1 aldo/keto reductase [Anaerolineae bacterium]MBT7990305.1 aldo/keto reductase [Anaerolineae bacterium]
MEYRNLGRSGLKVSALSFGAWVTFGDQIGERAAQAMMQAAIDAGVNFFDNAEVYAGGKAETMMGKVVKKAGWKRSDLVFSTKIFWGGDGVNDKGLSRKHIVEGVDTALKRLQMDYVDLVFAHRPDLHTPIEETVRAFNHVIDQGKAFYWGTSEWSATQIMEAHGIARELGLIPPTMEQPQYHMFHRDRFEAKYAPLYDHLGLGTTIWSPLASGLLTGKYNAGMPKGTRATLKGYEWLRRRFTDETALANIAKVGKLMNIADELGCTMAQLALAWTLKNPNVSTTITGASRAEQVVENMKAIDYVEKLTPDVMEAIEVILDNKPDAEQDWR